MAYASIRQAPEFGSSLRRASGPAREGAAVTTTTAPPPQREYAPEIPAKNLPPVPYRDLPEAPPLRKVLGPSVILLGVGIATGEYVLWPTSPRRSG
jgi:hypothetical protein